MFAAYATVGLLVAWLYRSDLSPAEIVVFPLGIVCGFVFAWKVLGTTGLSVWLSPIVGVVLVAGAAQIVIDGLPVTLRHSIIVALAALAAILIGHVVSIMGLFVQDRLSSKPAQKSDGEKG